MIQLFYIISKDRKDKTVHMGISYYFYAYLSADAVYKSVLFADELNIFSKYTTDLCGWILNETQRGCDSKCE